MKKTQGRSDGRVGREVHWYLRSTSHSRLGAGLDYNWNLQRTQRQREKPQVCVGRGKQWSKTLNLLWKGRIMGVAKCLTKLQWKITIILQSEHYVHSEACWQSCFADVFTSPCPVRALPMGMANVGPPCLPSASGCEWELARFREYSSCPAARPSRKASCASFYNGADARS